MTATLRLRKEGDLRESCSYRVVSALAVVLKGRVGGRSDVPMKRKCTMPRALLR